MPTRRPRQRTSHDAATVRRKILPARDATPIRSMLYYARNKVGKTLLSASAGLLGKTLIIDCEEGTSSLTREGLVEAFGEQAADRILQNVSVYKLSSYEEIDEIYWYLANQDHGYKFVSIDPITALGERCMDFVLRDKASKDLASDPYTPERQDWGRTAALMRKVITDYRALPGIFLLITAYERTRDNEEEDAESTIVIGPDAQRAVKGHLMGKVDIIGRLYIKPVEGEEGGVRRIERRMLFGSHEVYEAGDRSGNLPRVMRMPTMKKILERIERKANANT